MDIFEDASFLGFGDIHFKFDPATGLRAIIAIHSTHLGPALGGCRCVSYPSTEDAIVDAMRLARGMTYKSAISGLRQGGGKAVVMRPRQIRDREAYFESFGRFVDELGGRYITAVDSGTSVADMDVIARTTKYVACTSAGSAGTDDPSPHTAVGVRRGLEAAVKFKVGQSDLDGIHVAIQGVGHVGYPLANQLHERGARLTVSDTSKAAVERCIDEFNADVVAPEDIYDVECDVFSPNALGAVINDDTLSRLRTKIIGGAANNQLAEPRHGDALHQRRILYAPDYVINAGGVIQIATDKSVLSEKLSGIYDTLMRIFEDSAKKDEAPHRVADAMVDAILASPAKA
jgi:leucine dehydrogenase